MISVVGVRFKKAGKIYYFHPGKLDLQVGTQVIVETARGVEHGEVVVRPKMVPEEDLGAPLKQILRVACSDDMAQIEKGRSDEKEAFRIGSERVARLGIDMKLVDVEWAFDRQKVIFYFTAEDRVDFRELVKDLAGTFRTRVELRQVGARDRAKMLDGYGVCGRALCCATWIGDFEPISIRHAKDQELSLNPNKISGVCGRLKCCLRYEADMYREIRSRLPKVGDIVATVHGVGKVIEIHVIKETVTVLIQGSDEMRRVQVSADEIVPEGEDAAAGDVGTPEVPKSPARSRSKERPKASAPTPDADEPAAPASADGGERQGAKRRRRRSRKRRQASGSPKPGE